MQFRFFFFFEYLAIEVVFCQVFVLFSNFWLFKQYIFKYQQVQVF